jgi:hypothetical protein
MQNAPLTDTENETPAAGTSSEETPRLSDSLVDYHHYREYPGDDY